MVAKVVLGTCSCASIGRVELLPNRRPVADHLDEVRDAHGIGRCMRFRMVKIAHSMMPKRSLDGVLHTIGVLENEMALRALVHPPLVHPGEPNIAGTLRLLELAPVVHSSALLQRAPLQAHVALEQEKVLRDQTDVQTGSRLEARDHLLRGRRNAVNAQHECCKLRIWRAPVPGQSPRRIRGTSASFE